MAAFVTDGDQRATLAVVRALGRAGIPVTVGSSERASLAGSSRYCAESVRYPSPLEDGEGFRAFLRSEIPSGRYKVLIPMTDVTLRLVGQEAATLSARVQLPVPTEAAFATAQDKQQMVLLARQLGIGHPETRLLADGETVEEVARSLRYPAVIKPRLSRFLRDGRWVQGIVQYAQGPDDLIAKYRAASALIPGPLIQEKIEGEGRGVFLLLWDGELKAAFSHRRLREKPPWGGESVYRESVPLDRGLVEKSVALLRAIGWQGVAMVEYKLDARDGRAKLMEVNGRFWGSLQLAIDAGINFPLLLYRLANGENVSPEFIYRTGVKCRWLLGDLDHLLIRLRSRSEANGLGAPEVSKVRACVRFLKFYEPDLHYEILRWDDPRPGWVELKSYFRATLGSLVKGGGSGAH